jgi:hypothetical protein
LLAMVQNSSLSSWTTTFERNHSKYGFMNDPFISILFFVLKVVANTLFQNLLSFSQFA